MSNDPRIIELLSEMLIEQRQANHKLSGVQEEISAMREEQRETNRRLATLAHQQEISNIKQDAMIDEFVRLRTAIINWSYAF